MRGRPPLFFIDGGSCNTDTEIERDKESCDVR